VVIEGVFESALVGGVIFRAATKLDENAIVEVQEQVRRRLLHSLVRRAACSRPTTRATWRSGSMRADFPLTPRLSAVGRSETLTIDGE
jgi:hypothetical protein